MMAGTGSVFDDVEMCLKDSLPQSYRIERDDDVQSKDRDFVEKGFVDCMSWRISVKGNDKTVWVKAFLYDCGFIAVEVYGHDARHDIPYGFPTVDVMKGNHGMLASKIQEMTDSGIDAYERIYGDIERLLKEDLPSGYLIERIGYTLPKGSVSPAEDFIDCASWWISRPGRDGRLELKVFLYDSGCLEFEVYCSEFGPSMPDAYCPMASMERTVEELASEIRLRMGDIDDEG